MIVKRYVNNEYNTRHRIFIRLTMERQIMFGPQLIVRGGIYLFLNRTEFFDRCFALISPAVSA